ncbi:MAG: MATE family efflux transporter, partial [Calditrichia bacterium]|nr:MATE family efflux transporter [Calditrichia bacterium]
MNNKKEFLGTENINKLLIKLSLPAMVAMLANAFYNVIDTIFIGQGIGTLGIGGIAIALPVQMIVLAFSLLIGIGSGSMVSRYFGAKKFENVNYVAGNAFLLLGIFGLLFSVTGFIYTERIVEWFGTTDTIAPYAITYVRILFIGSLYFPFCIAGNNLLRAEGNAKNAMNLMLVGFAVNLILDYIFIFPLNMGMAGAAIATVIAKLVSFIYLIFYFLSKKTSIKIRLKYFKPNWKIIWEMLTIGSSGFAMAFAGSAVIVIVNRLLGQYGGDLALAVYGIVYKVILFLIMPLVGINQGMQPIVG